MFQCTCIEKKQTKSLYLNDKEHKFNFVNQVWFENFVKQFSTLLSIFFSIYEKKEKKR